MITHIVLIYSTMQSGDVSHAKALEEIWQKSTPKIQITHQDVKAKAPEVSSDLDNNETLYLAIGEVGLDALAELKKSNENIQAGASLHQYFDKIKDIKLSFIALPEAVVNTQARELVIRNIPNKQLTLGVPTKNLPLPQLKELYDSWQVNNKPSLEEEKPYMIVMLPGDAPDASGKQHLFTQESANKLFNDLEPFFGTHKFIIQNGPRTGKFNEDGKPACSHEYLKGGDPKQAEDAITNHFVSKLQEAKVDYKLFNFAFEVEELDELDEKGNKKRKLTSNSVFNQTLYLLQANTKNIFILPGESISNISQVPFYAAPSQVIVFKPSSMNPQHELIMDEFIKQGHVAYFNKEGTVVYPEEPVKLEINDDDATKVANAVMQIGQAKQRAM